MSFKSHYHCVNLSLISGATAVQRRLKSHTFTVNLAVKGLFLLLLHEDFSKILSPSKSSSWECSGTSELKKI